jgi:hypothetical protein
VESPIEEARALLAELLEATPAKESAAAGILLRPKSARMIERLVRYHEGYAAGVTASEIQISSVASALLLEIAKLRAARRGGRSLADDFIEGTAPRLFSLAERLRELLEH